MSQRMAFTWLDLFPYEPTPQQKMFCRDASICLSDEKVLFTEACNGFGKTVASLAVALSLGRKVVYAVRTHGQAIRVFEELAKINGLKRAPPFSAVIYAAREHLCLVKECATHKNSEEASDICRSLREAKKCNFKIEDVELPEEQLLTVDALRRFGEAAGVCPYYAARHAAQSADVVIVFRPHVFHKVVRERSKLPLAGSTLILDEAHNLDQSARDALSESLSTWVVGRAMEEADGARFRGTFQMLDKLRQYIAEAEVDTLKPIERLREELHLKVSNSFNLTKLIWQADVIWKKKTERGEIPAVSRIGSVARFLGHIQSADPKAYTSVFSLSKRKYPTLKCVCLDPSLAMDPIKDMVKGMLIMSGTLSPLDLFAELLGMPDAAQESYPSIVGSHQVSLRIVTKVTTLFKRRTLEMMMRYAQEVKRRVGEASGGTLVFFPSKGLRDEWGVKWKESGVFGGRPVFVEGKTRKENAEVLRFYRGKVKEGANPVLLGVCRGKNTEGSNFPDNEARTIILIGVPYANAKEPLVEAQLDYLERRFKRTKWQWYAMDAMRVANQALGRGIRHRDDRCRFIAMDSRFKTHQKMFSKHWRLGGVAVE